MSRENQIESCNVTAYRDWYSSPLSESDGILELEKLRVSLLEVDRSDSEAWRIMGFDLNRDQFLELYGGRRPKMLEISTGQAMELSTVWCQEMLIDIFVYTAGLHGPPSNISIHDAMCDKYCIASDTLRDQAMRASQCDCLQISTQNSSMSYTTEGDFCQTNSAAMLCSDSTHDMCSGVMNCELSDYNCPRKNYNRIDVPLRGFGDDCSNDAGILSSWIILSYVALAFVYYAGL